MISNNDEKEILAKEYHIDNYEYLINELLLPDYRRDKHPTEFDNDLFSSVTYLGESSDCEVSVFEVYLKEGCHNKRVTITQAMFRILRNQAINNALVAFVNENKKNFRISLLTSKYEVDGNKIVKVLSNPRRFSYSLGYKTKTKTAYKFLISKGKVSSLDELISRFSVEVVNKEFYTEIATAFTKLVGGNRNGKKYEKQLSIFGVDEHSKYAEFGVRLIGRIMFCWFLKEKHSSNNLSLVPKEMLSRSTIRQNENYYHQTLEPLFFELLNTPQKRRKPEFNDEISSKVPYLNGGLFSPHDDDKYEYDAVAHAGKNGMVEIPNTWFRELYDVLNEYNFTVDENTAYDIELSIDPEMLGRIFENLLAEINPETGENAKKSTGSFYTPRDIVDYMVDSSICEYLKNKTDISEDRINALITYGIDGEELAVFNEDEKNILINALYTITVLDPACGSGAFPIGMLQKIVYILEKLDPNASLWLDRQLESADTLMKKSIKAEYEDKSLDYIRKLTVIKNSIFGVDIQSIAVEISRLRCFLSLIIEEKVDDSKENRGINPLPNLDFKFITANSLKKIPDGAESKQCSLFEDNDHIEALKKVRENYFNSTIEERMNLQIEFYRIQKKMLQFVDPSKRTDKYNALGNWEPFRNEGTDWFDPEWMFGVEDGFDIVIGNPPYIGFHKVPDKEYNKKFFCTANGKYDYYVLFIEKAIELASKTGFVTYICPSYFYKRNYGKNTRSFLLNHTSICYIADFADFQVFESVQTYTCIFGVSKQLKNNNRICVLNELLSKHSSHYIEQAELCEPTWNLDNKETNKIIEKVNKHIWHTLGEITKSISQGIVTGNNDVFLIADDVIINNNLEQIYLKNAYKGKDVHDGNIYYGGYKIFYPYIADSNKKTTCISEFDFMNNAPNLYNYLSGYKDLLLSREYFKKSNKKWYELWNCRKIEHFNSRKFVFSEIGLKNDFVLVDECFYTDSVCGTELKDEFKPYENFIYRYLNSKLATYIYKKTSVPKANGYSIYKNAFLKNMPILIHNDDYVHEIDEDSFNNYLYNLIGLSDSEKEQIETYIESLK